ncbi:MAG: YybH family protein [Candidatus Binatia bacterium]
MKTIAILCFASLTASFAGAQDAQFEGAVDAVAQKYADAWKAGDAAACASLYSDDADVIGLDGVTAKGKAAIQESLAQSLATFPGSSLQIVRTGIHVVSPDVVVSDGTWEITGGQRQPAAEGAPTKGFYTVVLTKEGDTWQIVANRSKVPPPAN